jgi:hypothetical protein
VVSYCKNVGFGQMVTSDIKGIQSVGGGNIVGGGWILLLQVEKTVELLV